MARFRAKVLTSLLFLIGYGYVGSAINTIKISRDHGDGAVSRRVNHYRYRESEGPYSKSTTSPASPAAARSAMPCPVEITDRPPIQNAWRCRRKKWSTGILEKYHRSRCRSSTATVLNTTKNSFTAGSPTPRSGRPSPLKSPTVTDVSAYDAVEVPRHEDGIVNGEPD